MLINPTLEFIGSVADAVKKTFSDITYLLERNLDEGDIEFIKTKTETITSRGPKGERSILLYVIPYNICNEGTNNIEQLYEAIYNLSKEYDLHGSKTIRLVAAGKVDIDYMRKCAKYVFRNTNTTIDVTTPRKRKSTQHADIFKRLKNSADIDEVGVQIKNNKKLEEVT